MICPYEHHNLLTCTNYSEVEYFLEPFEVVRGVQNVEILLPAQLRHNQQLLERLENLKTLMRSSSTISREEFDLMDPDVNEGLDKSTEETIGLYSMRQWCHQEPTCNKSLVDLKSKMAVLECL